MGDTGGDVGGVTHQSSNSLLARAAARLSRKVFMTAGSGASYLYVAGIVIEPDEAVIEAVIDCSDIGSLLVLNFWELNFSI